MVDEVRHLNQSKQALFADVPRFSASDPLGEIEVAYQWTTGTTEEIHSLVNGIATPQGGMHVEGFKKALTGAINEHARSHMVDPNGNELLGADVPEGLTTVISVRLDDPQFGPKNRLDSLGIRSLMERATNEAIGRWLIANPNDAALIREKAMQAKRRRERR